MNMARKIYEIDILAGKVEPLKFISLKQKYVHLEMIQDLLACLCYLVSLYVFVHFSSFETEYTFLNAPLLYLLLLTREISLRFYDFDVM